MNRTTLFILLTTCLIATSNSLSCSEGAAHFENTVCDSEEPAFVTDDEMFYAVTVNGYEHRLITGGLRSTPYELLETKKLQRKPTAGILQVIDRIEIGNSQEVIMFDDCAKDSLLSRLYDLNHAYGEHPEELFKFMAQLLRTLSTFRSEYLVLKKLKVGNILLTESGLPLIYDLSSAVNIYQQEYVSQDANPLSYGENIDLINKQIHTPDPADDLFKAGLVMYNLMYSKSPYPTKQYSNVQYYENINIFFASTVDIRAFDICSQLLYSFKPDFDLSKLILFTDDCASNPEFQKMSNYTSYNLGDGPEEAMDMERRNSPQYNQNMQGNRMFNDQRYETPQLTSEINIQSPSLQRKEVEYIPTYQEKRMFNDQPYHSPQYEHQDNQTNEYGMHSINYDYKQGSMLSKSLTLDENGTPTKGVVIIICIVGTFLFNIAAIIFLLLSCKKDYYSLLVGRNEDIQLSTV